MFFETSYGLGAVDGGAVYLGGPIPPGFTGRCVDECTAELYEPRYRPSGQCGVDLQGRDRTIRNCPGGITPGAEAIGLDCVRLAQVCKTRRPLSATGGDKCAGCGFPPGYTAGDETITRPGPTPGPEPSPPGPVVRGAGGGAGHEALGPQPAGEGILGFFKQSWMGVPAWLWLGGGYLLLAGKRRR